MKSPCATRAVNSARPQPIAMDTNRVTPESTVREILSRGANFNAVVCILLGLVSLVGAGLCVALIFERMSEAGYLGDAGEKSILVGIPLLLLGLYLLVPKGFRSLGARGSRVGRIALDFPERASVQAIARRIVVNGIPVRTAHILSITVDGNDSMEVQLSPVEVPRVLAAFSAWCGLENVHYGSGDVV